MNLQKYYMGESFDAYEYFGAHLEDGGVVFRTYAPNAWGIHVVGEFNGWKEEPMQQLYQSGVWVGFSKTAKPGQMYKFVVYGQNGRVEHCDPYGFGMELRPGACSIIRDLTEYKFTDAAWMRQRTRCYDKPAHDSFHRYIGELNRLYLKKKAIWAQDHTYDGFKCVDCKSDNKCVFGYIRTYGTQTLLALFNFSDKEAGIAPELDASATMLLHTDWDEFGGNTCSCTKESIVKQLPTYC